MAELICRDARALIDARIDDEITGADRQALDAHLAGCAACGDLARGHRRIHQLVKAEASRFRPSEAARARLRAALPEAAPPVPPPRSRPPKWWLGAWGGSVAALAASLALFIATPPPIGSLPGELLAAHVRSLMDGHLSDVVSSDQHTVKPWFNGRVDVSPPVPDLAGQGYPLVGGRLDYIDQRPAAALVYRRRQHLINLFTWPTPADGDATASLSTRNGYQIIVWRRAGLAYAVVSDLNTGELEAFTRLWMASASPPEPPR